jgi:hypothetical protein
VKIQVTVLPTEEVSKKHHHALPRGVGARSSRQTGDAAFPTPPDNGTTGSYSGPEVGLSEVYRDQYWQTIGPYRDCPDGRGVWACADYVVGQFR